MKTVWRAQRGHGAWPEPLPYLYRKLRPTNSMTWDDDIWANRIQNVQRKTHLISQIDSYCLSLRSQGRRWNVNKERRRELPPPKKILKEIEFLNSTNNNETTKIINFLLRCTLCCCYCWKKIVVHLWHLVSFWQQLCLCSQTSVELSVNGMKTFVDTNDWLASIFMSNSYHLKQRADKCHKTATQCDNIDCWIENRY